MTLEAGSGSQPGVIPSSGLLLAFPWGHTVVHSPSDLTPRESKYLQWCLDRDRPSSTRSRRFLSLVGFLTYRQALWVDRNWKEKK